MVVVEKGERDVLPRLRERLDRGFEFRRRGIAKVTGLADFVEDVGVLVAQRR